MGPLQMAAGAASEYFAPGNPFGIPLMTGGLGQAVGTGMGGGRGGMMGEVLGGAAGGLGEGLLGMGPLGSTLGTTGTGQSLQNYLGGTSLGKYLGLNPAAPGGPLSSVAAGVTPTMTGQPGAFPAPGAPPVAIDPATGQMVASLQGPQTATPPAGAPATGTPATTNVPSPTGAQPAQPNTLANNIGGAVATDAALKVTNPQPQQQPGTTPAPPRPAATPPATTPTATQPTVTTVPTPPSVPTPTPPVAPAGPAGAGVVGPPVSAATPTGSSQLNRILSMVGGGAAQGQEGVPLSLTPGQQSTLTSLLRMLGGT